MAKKQKPQGTVDSWLKIPTSSSGKPSSDVYEHVAEAQKKGFVRSKYNTTAVVRNEPKK
jgi:hypothetical protein